MTDLLLEILAIVFIMGVVWGVLEISYDALFEEDENEPDTRD